MNCSKFVELHMIKEYQAKTNRYFVRIKLNYVDCTISILFTLFVCVVYLRDSIETVFQWLIYRQISI